MAPAVNSMEVLKDGLVGRGVLLDIPRLRGVPWLEPGEHVSAEDLDAAERDQRVPVGEGDIRLVRTTIPGVSPSSAHGTRVSPRPGYIRLRCGSSDPAQPALSGPTATAIPRRALPAASTSRFMRSPSPRWGCTCRTTPSSRT
jgi:hypothetical protein